MRTPAETTAETVQADLAALSDESIVAVAGVVFIGLEELGFVRRLSSEVAAVLAAYMVELVHLFAGVGWGASADTEAEEGTEEEGDNAGA